MNYENFQQINARRERERASQFEILMIGKPRPGRANTYLYE